MSAPKWIDIHTHLSSKEFDQDRAEVLTKAFEICDAFIDIGSGTSRDAFARAKDFSETDPRIFFTAGIHPHDADTLGGNVAILEEIRKLSLHPKCVAIGECGLDYFYKHSTRESQIRIFEWHIHLSKAANLPLMIHTRDAEADTQKILGSYSGGAIFHCFTGTQDLANFGIQKGFFISFSGIVTFKNAEELRKVFLATPVENILIETDSPYLAPVPMRGKRNETSFIEHTAKFLANLRGIPLEEFAKITTHNAKRAFPKLQL